MNSMAKLWELYVRADPHVKGYIDSRVRDIANSLAFEEVAKGVSARDIMTRLYNTEITPEVCDSPVDSQSMARILAR